MCYSEDTIDVRPEERFDTVRLREYLKGSLEGTQNKLKVRQFSGGAANLTYLLDYGTHEYVLRRPPLGPVAPTSHDMAREYRVLSILYKTFPCAPQAFLFCDDSKVIGASFFIMERKRGVVVRKTVPEVFVAMEDSPRRMSEALVDRLAEFHAVDFASLGLGDLGRPEGFIQRQVEGWFKRWEAAKHEDLEEMDDLYAWLTENLPTVSDTALVHNDYKLDNLMFSPTDPGHVVAIFDWDMCTLGDPLNDLGALLCYWSEPSDPAFFKRASMMPTDVHFLTREALVQRYAEKGTRNVTNIRFYHVLGLFRLIGIAAQIYIRFVRGQTKDARFAAFGDLIPLISRYALSLIAKT
ncbi:MAG: phosphotransferase family protein [Candidatus Marinimicrobia bacterium]|jgi:aminoglycoside phosphotransferase (APT) family kinase protein|nr:phosphotransferase family protein [Candidatus Neomarinimicrobiota bacterium]MDP6836779.1 phosphotransferase family protein [Candidatus Neomarinimicrobiota bacterium]|tara:strand:- start:1720 stop:2775 length:1056 start_codon:yes stop_codon:yes gene_type:complete